MRFLVAPDKFKGSLTAEQAAQHIAAGWDEAWPNHDYVIHPIADGGDGTLAVVQSVTQGDWRESPARNLRGVTQSTPWLWQKKEKSAWIETALVAGLANLGKTEKNPLTATTAGLGDLIDAAEAHGAERVYLCLGGSATNDAGCGMAEALGFRFLGKDGKPFDPIPKDLRNLDRIERPDRFRAIEFVGLTDVGNPLLGAEGASLVYGPQKGASPEEADNLEDALTHFAFIAQRDLGAPDPATARTGAAGGLGYGLICFLGAKLQSGFETIAAMTGLPQAIAEADLIITGEGRLDPQTNAGKAPSGVAQLAKQYGKPVIAIAGSIPLTNQGAGTFSATASVTNQPMTLDQALEEAGPLLEQAAARTGRLVRIGTLL